jgi:hypothetical protein
MSSSANPEIILSSLQELEKNLELLFPPFAKVAPTFYNEERLAVIDDISAISRKSIALVEGIDIDNPIYYKPIMLCNYIQGFGRLCYCLTYGLHPKPEQIEKMWMTAHETFESAELLAQLLDDTQMADKINNKKSIMYPQIASDWSRYDIVDHVNDVLARSSISAEIKEKNIQWTIYDHSLKKIEFSIEAWKWLINYYKDSDIEKAELFTKSLTEAQRLHEKFEKAEAAATSLLSYQEFLQESEPETPERLRKKFIKAYAADKSMTSYQEFLDEFEPETSENSEAKNYDSSSSNSFSLESIMLDICSNQYIKYTVLGLGVVLIVFQQWLLGIILIASSFWFFY